jgi:hypothetical protein
MAPDPGDRLNGGQCPEMDCKQFETLFAGIRGKRI